MRFKVCAIAAAVAAIAALAAGCAESYPESEGDPTTVKVFEVHDGERTSLGTFDRQEGLDRASELAGFNVAVPDELPPVHIDLYSVAVHIDASGETAFTRLAYFQNERFVEGEWALYIDQPPPGTLLNPDQPGFDPFDAPIPNGCERSAGVSLRGDRGLEAGDLNRFEYVCPEGGTLEIIRHFDQSFRIKAHGDPRPGLETHVIRDMIQQVD